MQEAEARLGCQARAAGHGSGSLVLLRATGVQLTLTGTGVSRQQWVDEKAAGRGPLEEGGDCRQGTGFRRQGAGEDAKASRMPGDARSWAQVPKDVFHRPTSWTLMVAASVTVSLGP
ncbi:hypothetical protein OPT61_g9598 [Boeremia exigua]|uniref:Uncharacterized protein n=1 Tax=Boeremia exigua TaxID=749465 RepID=A0ACC2HTQ8_9PLEO|nr:hypothetical protein OPT61_g9598 [Boeremia exigua]